MLALQTASAARNQQHVDHFVEEVVCKAVITLAGTEEVVTTIHPRSPVGHRHYAGRLPSTSSIA
jgi:hypothetical protein